MPRTEKKTNSIELTDTAVRFLKASTLGTGISDRDIQDLRAAADAEDLNLPSEQLACHILLREIRKRRIAATSATGVS
jgi:hypothetical protein